MSLEEKFSESILTKIHHRYISHIWIIPQNSIKCHLVSLSCQIEQQWALNGCTLRFLNIKKKLWQN